jgi:hypothetical protein
MRDYAQRTLGLLRRAGKGEDSVFVVVTAERIKRLNDALKSGSEAYGTDP